MGDTATDIAQNDFSHTSVDSKPAVEIRYCCLPKIESKLKLNADICCCYRTSCHYRKFNKIECAIYR